MAKRAFKMSLALAETLRSRRRELGLTLREVVRETEAAGSPIPVSTLAKIEQGRLDPGIQRLHLLLKLYHIPIQMAGDVLDLEEIAADLPKTHDPQVLYQDAVELWKRGEIREALAHFFALRHMVSDEAARFRQKALLGFAIASASLGKLRMALKMIEGLLLEPVRPELRVDTYVQAAVVWDGLQCPDVALAFLERARCHVPPGDAKQHARVLHKTADVLRQLGQLEQATACLERALQAYRDAADAYGESLALRLPVRLRQAAGDLEGALQAAQEARRHAEQHGFGRVVILRRLQEGSLLTALGRGEEGLDALREGLAGAVASEDRPAQFYAHYYLWKANEAMGQNDRARFERRAAEYFVQFVDEMTEETREVRGAADRKGG
jgi:tetratricopeptide (TPR) repeat protein